MPKTIYKMWAKVWLYPGAALRQSSQLSQGYDGQAGQAGAWHFITLPKKESEEIKKNFSAKRRGWGSLPVAVTVGKTSWRTSIFPDKKAGVYLLPLKAAVRKREGVENGDTVTFSLEIKT